MTDITDAIERRRKTHGDTFPFEAFRCRIEDTCRTLAAFVAKKNVAYGDSIFRSPSLAPWTPPGDAILVRMSDKIGRLRNLEENDVDTINESYTDTLKDLAGYAVLLRISMKRTEGVNLASDTQSSIAREFDIVSECAQTWIHPLVREAAAEETGRLSVVIRRQIDVFISDIANHDFTEQDSRIREKGHAYALSLAVRCIMLLAYEHVI